MYFFNKPYNKKAFQEFLERDFLPDDFRIEKEKTSLPPGASRITEIEKIGKVPSLDNLVVYEIHHQSENDPRVSLTRESFSLLKHYGEKNALAVYFSEKSDNYRFSLITSGFKITEKGHAKRKFSSPRRFSFYLGPDARVKTPTQYLKKKGKVANLDDLQSRFDIQVLTKQFYKELSNWYFWALKNVEFPEDAESQNGGRNIAVIRLITRLVFIWFMKKKGLVPDRLFDLEKVENILIDLGDKQSSYYRAILQNLFFATLNTQIKNRTFRSEIRRHKGYNPDFMRHNVYRYHGLFQKSEKMEEIFSGIPFLNGGLFECLDSWEKENGENEYTRIDGFTSIKKHQPKVPNFLFFSSEQEVDLNQEYGTKNKRHKAKGLVNILNDYNFTIDENTPIDQEVSLDPELLGQIFENLLASYNPETATTARKATGSYYTPRPIVEYMVDESLKQYFLEKLRDTERDKNSFRKKIDKLLSYYQEKHRFNKEQVGILIKAIEELRIIDPAVGSGAFPMGVLQKLVLVLNKLDPNNEKWKERQIQAVNKSVTDANLKRKLLRKIEEDFETNQLDYGRKLYLIQKCIYGVDIQPIAIQIAKLRFFISLLVDESIEEGKENKGIEPLPNLETKFVSANSLISLENNTQQMLKAPKVAELEKELRKIRADYFNASLPEEKRKVREQDKKVREELLQELEKFGFGDKSLEQMAGWDPYDTNTASEFFDPEWMFGIEAFDIVIANPPYIKEYTDKSAFDGARNKKCYQGKMDIWYLFGCLGLKLLRPKGIECFIAQNNWITSYGASRFRNKIIKEARILSFVDFGNYKVFESSGINTMVYVAVKDNSLPSYLLQYRRLENDNIPKNQLSEFLRTKGSTKDYRVYGVDFKRVDFIDNYITFFEPAIDRVIKKMMDTPSTKLKDNEATNGIHAHHDSVNYQRKAILGDDFRIGQGIFTLSQNEKESLSLNKKESSIIKPEFTSEEIFKYYTNPQNKHWIIYTDSSFKNSDKIKKYPNIKNHLDQFKRVITSDNKPYGLHRAREESFFKGEKIVSYRKCSKPTFSYSNFDCYVSATFYIIKTDRFNMKFLTGLLNSKAVAFWLWHKGKKQGSQYQVDKEPLKNIPIPRITSQNQPLAERIRKLVDKILKKKEQNQNASTEDLEAQIDQLVYKLYTFTPEEVEVVERNFKQ